MSVKNYSLHNFAGKVLRHKNVNERQATERQCLRQTVNVIDQFFIRYNRNKVSKEYSTAYKVNSEQFEEMPNSYYKPSRAHLKKT